jgi:hypothetical protein
LKQESHESLSNSCRPLHNPGNSSHRLQRRRSSHRGADSLARNRPTKQDHTISPQRRERIAAIVCISFPCRLNSV